MSVEVQVKDMLESGVHFGHQTRRWNPKMRPYIFASRDGIHIIDLEKTANNAKQAYKFVADTVALGSSVLFVGTKKQAKHVIEEEAKRVGQYYVTNRWLGGMLTNFKTIKQSIQRLNDLYTMKEKGDIDKLTKKEGLKIEREIEKLEYSLGGIKSMTRAPGAVFIVDPNQENIAKKEAIKLGIPIIALTDTNSDPDGINILIPGNDDAIRSIQYFVHLIAEACAEGEKRHEAALKEREAEDAKEKSTRGRKLVAEKEQKIGGKGRAWVAEKRKKGDDEKAAAEFSAEEAEKFASAKAEKPEESEAPQADEKDAE